METTTRTLSDMLNSSPAERMEIGSIYHINKIDRIIESTNQRTGELQKSVIVSCDEGLFFLPNTIAASYLENPEENREALEGKTVKCVKFKSKKYNSTGRTITYYKEA